MRLIQLHCRAFRCLAEFSFSPAEGINVIHGHNAQGKTTVLESILYAATSKSHRTTHEAAMVQYGKPRFEVRARVARKDREVAIEALWNRAGKRFKINGVPQTRISDILGRVHVVFFSPEDIELIKGGASVRRRFLDMELSQISPAYLSSLQQYRQVLRQRNELLKVQEPDPKLLDVWDVQLVQHGCALIDQRAAFVDELSPLAGNAYGRMAAERLSLRYLPDVAAAGLAEALEKGRHNDVRRRATNKGPHRDDVEVLIDERPAREYGSQGQQKTAALAIKLAELELVNQRMGEYPILLLDEVLAELDLQRSARLFESLNPAVQCIVTTTSLQERIMTFNGPHTDFHIQAGKLSAASAIPERNEDAQTL